MLGQPAFAVGLANRQTQGQLLETHRVAGVLGIHGVDRVLRVVDGDAAAVLVRAGHPFADRTGAVTELEELEILGAALSLEFLVALAIQHVLAVDDVGGIGDLQARDREDRVRGTQTEEPDEHGAALVRAALEVLDLSHAGVAVELLEFGVQCLILGHEILGDLRVASLVPVGVEVNRVALDRQR